MRRSIALVALGLELMRPAYARAFSGFYVGDEPTVQLVSRASQVVVMREGTHTVLSMQNEYEGPPERFALVVPVPTVLHEDDVKTLPRELFAKLEQLDAPRLVEYWEQDPCAQSGLGEEAATPPHHVARPRGSAAPEDLGVTVEAKFAVGEYEIVALSADDSAGLLAWLRREGYAVPADAEPYVRPYVARGSKFIVAKVDPTKVKLDDGRATLSPLRFDYESDTFALPVRLGLVDAKDTQDLVVHVLARGQRYEAANYENVAIPTNLDVDESIRGEFATAYDALFDDTLRAHPRAVVTEYAWDAGTCDPCPVPALTAADIATLGGDVVASPQPPVRGRRSAPAWVLTRLHARYDKTSLGEDLVFRAAPPISGGREVVAFGATLDRTAVPSAFNNFQARYAIRRAWSGPIACEHPVRGVWGGPPSGQPDERPRTAIGLAFAARDASKLSLFDGYHEAAVQRGTADGGAIPTPPTPGKRCGCDVSGMLLVGWIVRRKRP